MPPRNRLAAETSPYLRQHADNPVDWYAWGDEAFAEARRRDVPVLLSVGYSSCHWCHVMAHESFEDPEVAALMNDLFVNVKVDREERPDVDEVYMEAVQALTGQGGWPMTVFLTPDGRPFFAGTYFPREPRRGMVSFPDLCRRVDEVWRDRRDALDVQADRITETLGRASQLAPAGGVPGEDALDTAFEALRRQHDDAWGGFGGPPKFPQAMSLDGVVRHVARTGSAPAHTMIETSLDAMASGGIYDHIGGGFARYSVDGTWLVPHFEKMLYDQALLARLYLHAWQVTGHERYRQVLDETVGYVLRDLRHPDGGFFSAEDADSEGVEGKFYVWTPDDVVAALAGDTDDGDQIATPDEVMEFYDITAAGNFEGRSIPNRIRARGQLARPPRIEAARRRLFAARERRVRPGLDDKVLTEWNALMLSSLAEAAAATGRDDWLRAAVANGEFLVRSLRRDDGRWLRSWQADGGASRSHGRSGRARHLAYAADHAALVDAFVRLGEATGEARWLDEARAVADDLVRLFGDDERGGVFTTGSDAEALVTRTKDLMDTATPSANSLAAVGLLRLAALVGDDTYRSHAEAILRLTGPLAAEHPTAFGHLLLAVDLAAHGIDEIVVAGDRPDLVRAVHERFLPSAVLAWGERYDSPLWAGRDDGRAYVCRNYACRLPATDVDTLVDQLAGAPA
ncbi:MAG TPA: thioredoxin domain-containing protein [Acidimicrobiales bacterium]